MTVSGKKPTIYEVAKLAGVSKSLVSLVLRNDPAVSEKRRQAVQQAVVELDYHPSPHARLLALQKTKTVGVLITDYKNLSYVNVVRGLREIFDDAGYKVVIADLHRSQNFPDDPIENFLSLKVDGIVVIAEPAGLRKNVDIPAVMIGNRETSILGADVVFSDDTEGSKLIVEHLLELGHRKLIHLTGVGGIALNRRRAFEDEILRAGLELNIFGYTQPTTELGGYLSTKEALGSRAEFTAIFAANDYMAAGAISALAENGIRVPEDVSVVGYDNAPIASDYVLKLTTVDDVGLAVGRNAAMQILERLGERGKTESKSILLKPELIQRQSTATPRTKS